MVTLSGNPNVALKSITKKEIDERLVSYTVKMPSSIRLKALEKSV